MAELSATAIGAPQRQIVRPAASQLSEGWITLLLHMLIIAITANSILRVDEGARSSVLAPIAIGGLLLGYVLARTPALDAIAHILAVVVGAGLTLAVSAIRSDGIGETLSRRGLNVFDLADRIISAQFEANRQALSDDDLVVIIALTLWLIGYSSAWMLYRRHWLGPALVIPATLMVVSLRFDQDQPTRSLAVFSLASLVMAARHHALMRQIEWARSRVPAPGRLAEKFTASGSVIAVVALIAGWVLPYQAPETWVNGVSDQLDRGIEQVTDRWNKIRGNVEGEGVGGSYSQFEESFRIGEQFKPSEDPVATLRTIDPTYLVARHYDEYDGASWTSNVDATYTGREDRQRAPAVNFQPNQTVPISSLADQERDLVSADITMLADKNELLLTTSVFAGANLPTKATLGWRQLDGVVFDVDRVDISEVPTHLQTLVLLLRQAEFNVDLATNQPIVANGPEAIEIERTRAELLLLPLETTLEFGPDNRVLLVVDGQVPNYDDIESVYFAQPGMIPTQYRVIGSVSAAGEDVLRSAGDDYPTWVSDRYLQLPESMTERTLALADQIVADAGADNPFDVAWAIQQYLRATYQYAENSQQSPADADAVDFFLFEKGVGRCEDYAGAMVVLLRAEGIPARLVGGYRTGDELTVDGDLLFREKQAHTWVEVYFPDYGWTPFEPTAIEPPFDYDGADVEALEPELTRPEIIEPTPTPEPTMEPVAEATPEPIPAIVDTPEEEQSFSDRLAGGLTWLTIGLTIAVAAVVAIFALLWAWSLRGLRPGAALYARTLRIGRLWGIEPSATMTPREFATEFGQTVPRVQRAVNVVADLYAAEQYGGLEVTDEVRHGGNQAWRAMRGAVMGWRPWRRRGGRGS